MVNSVTIGFSTTNKWISRIIRFVTRSRVSHAWLGYYDETLGQRMVMQAESWSYEVRPWARWLKENIRVAEFIVPDRERALTALRTIATALGSKYDFGSALLMGLKRWIGRLLKAPYRDPTKLMCSEAVVRFLQLAGYRVADGLDPEMTSPGQLLILIEADRMFVPLPKPPGGSTDAV